MSNRAKETVAYYLPADVRSWIDKQAKAENRSPSNFLSTLIQKLMERKEGE